MVPVGHFLHFQGEIFKVPRQVSLDHANAFGQTGFWMFDSRTISVLSYKDAARQGGQQKGAPWFLWWSALVRWLSVGNN